MKKVEYYSEYYRNDARAKALEIAKECNGTISESEVDCSHYPCPDGLDTWSGTVKAFFVEDENAEEVASVAWWDVRWEYADELGGRINPLKHYVVKYADIAGQILKGQFDEFDEAVNFATAQVQGEKLYDGKLNHNDFFWFEVFDTEVGEWNKEGELLDGFEDKIDEASVFCTRNYWK